ncbi:RNA polymerase sigma factor [Luteimonas sp. A478]
MDDLQRVDIAEEARLVRRARWGDRKAFETLYHRHAGAIHALALRLTGNAASAQDVTQDTFMQLLRFLGRMAPDRPLRPWLKRVAANAAIDRLRREQRLVDLGDVEIALAEPGAGPGQDHESLGLLQRFPPLVRTVVWLQVVEGWTHRELGKRFGRSESWSKSVVARTLARMREMIEVDE